VLARFRRTLTYANVASTIALVAALGTGGAYAADTIGSSDIINESILAEDVQGQPASGGNPAVDGTLTTNEIKNGTLRSVDIFDGTLQALDLGDGSVGAGEIIDGSVAHADLANDAVNGANVVNESLTASDLATDSVNATEVADDSIDSGEISNESLLASDLAPDSVGNSELGNNAVDTPNVVNNSLTTADVKGADVNGGGISVPVGYVPNGRCRQLDASIGGATAGEAVVFSTKAALQDGVLLYGQRVPSDGHVTFNVCNFSGTTQAVITNLPVRVITFG
jgi:hypothetical protein